MVTGSCIRVWARVHVYMVKTCLRRCCCRLFRDLLRHDLLLRCCCRLPVDLFVFLLFDLRVNPQSLAPGFPSGGIVKRCNLNIIDEVRHQSFERLRCSTDMPLSLRSDDHIAEYRRVAILSRCAHWLMSDDVKISKPAHTNEPHIDLNDNEPNTPNLSTTDTSYHLHI